MKILKLFWIVGVLSIMVSPVQASSVTKIIDFSGLSGWSGNQLTSADGDIMFTGIAGIDDNSFQIRTIGGGWGEVLESGPFNATAIQFDFTDPVSSFQFNTYGNTPGANWVLEAFDAFGNIIASQTYGRITLGATLDTVAGISSTSANISYATMTDYNPSFGLEGSVLYIDNFTYTAPIPEPSTYALMLGGLGLVGFMSYRRRKAAVKLI